MTAEQVLIQKIRVLPEEKKAKVLEFVKELEKEPGAANDNKNSDLESEEKARHERLMKLSGIGSSGRSDTSERVDEILAEGANKREGWSLP